MRLESGAAAAALAAARGVKTTTGIVGVPVVENAREELRTQLQAVLDAVAALPEHAEYRRSVEKTARFKLSALDGEAPDEQVEELLGRQLEEEIKMCRDELGLIPKMAGARLCREGAACTSCMLPAERRQAAGRAASGRMPVPPCLSPPTLVCRMEALGGAGGLHGGLARAARPCRQGARRCSATSCLVPPAADPAPPSRVLQVEFLEEHQVEAKVAGGAASPAAAPK